MKIGITGLGWVGGTVRQWFEMSHHELYLYDKFKNIGSIEEVNKADIIFVAVPTPFVEGKGYDDSALWDVFSTIKSGKIIVIKSTVMPGSTRVFQESYPESTVLFNPEFLRERTALEDFTRPDRQILGYARTVEPYVLEAVFSVLPAPTMYRAAMRSEEAELVKYFGNVFLASKVIFANQMFDICTRVGVDYDVVKEAASMDRRIGPSHLDVHDLGYRGYGGHCFPKDTRALLQFSKNSGVDTDFLESIERINKKLMPVDR
jgi:UDPglucose 6-dehydrogenase